MWKKSKTEKKTQVFHLSSKKSLGQNFLNNVDLVEKIAASVEASLPLKTGLTQPLVHEIGPGTGALSLALLKRGIKVKAIEKDLRSVQGLSITLAVDYPEQFEVIPGDILQWAPTENASICVGNIPYYITSPILLWFCRFYKHYQCGIFMVQNEVADRLQAEPGTKDYGRLTVRMQLFFTVEKLFVVPASYFVPRPKVDSAVVRLTPTDFRFVSAEEEKSFEVFTTLLFSARRKMLRRTLFVTLEEIKKKGDGNVQKFWDYAQNMDVTPETRPDMISPQIILSMHRFLSTLLNAK